MRYTRTVDAVRGGLKLWLLNGQTCQGSTHELAPIMPARRKLVFNVCKKERERERGTRTIRTLFLTVCVCVFANNEIPENQRILFINEEIEKCNTQLYIVYGEQIVIVLNNTNLYH